MGFFKKSVKKEEDAQQEMAAEAEVEQKKKKLTKKEREQAEKELRANLPSRSQVGNNGIFEMTGPLEYTFAVGTIPGGQFIPVQVTIQVGSTTRPKPWDEAG